MTESQELLAEYVRSGSETAFRKLVELYSGLVYSTALRLVDDDADRAKDVAQTVFIDLARMAAKLTRNSMLGGWLHKHTCFVASTLLRGERRRQAREHQALAMNTLSASDESSYKTIAPVLDEAIQRLGPDDRDVILLRFFEGHSLREAGEMLGVSENVAQKRVTRALGELRKMLGSRGAALSLTTLATILGAKAAAAAPTGMAVVLATTALTSVNGATAGVLVKAAAMSKVKAGLIAATLLFALTTSVLLLRPSRDSATSPAQFALSTSTNETAPEQLQAHENTQVPASPAPSSARAPELNRGTIPTASTGPTTPIAASVLPPPPTPQSFLTYKAIPGSQIRIDGDSTAHEWYMIGSMIGGWLVLPTDFQNTSSHDALSGLQQGVLKAKAEAIINVRSIHSAVKVGASIMDGLYQDALREKQYPRIVYDLAQIQLVTNNQKDFECDTQGTLSIAGVTNRIAMRVRMQPLEKGRLKLIGSVPLKMSDFGITPPAPNIGLGMMKCKDNVRVTFEWLLSPASLLVTRIETQPSVVNAALENADVLPTMPTDLRNLAFGRVPTTSDANATPEKLAQITDGIKTAESQDIVLLRKGLQWVQIDLGSPCEISSIGLWHAYDSFKKYHSVIIQTASDPDFTEEVQTLFNNDRSGTALKGNGSDPEYLESAEGRQIAVNRLTARYVRFYSRGSTESAMNEYTEIEIIGR